MRKSNKTYSKTPLKDDASAEPASSPPFSSEPLPGTLGVPALAEHCMREISGYRPGNPHIDQYGVELFLRATVQRNQDARQSVQQCFSETVRGWLHRHPRKEAAYRLDSEENYIAHTFERFWLTTDHYQQVDFSMPFEALRLLYASLNGTILDTLRTYSRPGEVPMPEPGDPGKPQVEVKFDSGELWNLIQRTFPSRREQHLAYLLFHCGLKPREIMHSYPQEFSDIRDIYSLRRNTMQLLLHNVDQLR